MKKVSVGLVRRDPPLEHHPARARHGEPVAVPGGFGRVAATSGTGGVEKVGYRLASTSAGGGLRGRVCAPRDGPNVRQARDDHDDGLRAIAILRGSGHRNSGRR